MNIKEINWKTTIWKREESSTRGDQTSQLHGWGSSQNQRQEHFLKKGQSS